MNWTIFWTFVAAFIASSILCSSIAIWLDHRERLKRGLRPWVWSKE